MYTCNLSRYVRYHIPWMSYHSIIPLQYVGTSSILSFNTNEITFNHRITAHHLQTRTYQQVFGFPNILTQTPPKYFPPFKKHVFLSFQIPWRKKLQKKRSHIEGLVARLGTLATWDDWFAPMALQVPFAVLTWGWRFLWVGPLMNWRMPVYRLFFNAGDCKVVEIVWNCHNLLWHNKGIILEVC